MDLLFDRCSWWSCNFACSCTCKLYPSVSSFAALLVVCEQQICHKLMKSAALTRTHPTPPLLCVCPPLFWEGAQVRVRPRSFPALSGLGTQIWFLGETRGDKDQNNWRIIIMGQIRYQLFLLFWYVWAPCNLFSTLQYRMYTINCCSEVIISGNISSSVINSFS